MPIVVRCPWCGQEWFADLPVEVEGSEAEEWVATVALDAAGTAVSVVARSPDQLAETVQQIDHQGGRALALPADITDQDALVRAVKQTEQQFGPIALLVNNAGANHPTGPVWEADADAWWRDIEVNPRGSFLVTRAVLPSMVERRRGRIINFSGGDVGRRTARGGGVSAYRSAKAALVWLTQQPAVEAAEYGVTCFVLQPGAVDAEMTRQVLEYMRARVAAGTPGLRTGVWTLPRCSGRRRSGPQGPASCSPPALPTR